MHEATVRAGARDLFRHFATHLSLEGAILPRKRIGEKRVILASEQARVESDAAKVGGRNLRVDSQVKIAPM